MIVEKEAKEEYRKIKVILETKKEAELMYHLVNNGPGMPLKDYCKSHDISENDMHSLTNFIYGRLCDLGVNDCWRTR